MAGILSKGIKLYYNSGSGSTETWTEITGLQSIPDMGGAADKVDVTTLADANYKYISGIKDFGDLEFGFLYDNSGATSNYRVCKGFEGAGIKEFKVEFPDAPTTGTGTHHGTEISFSGEVSTTLNGQEVNSAITFKMNITLNSDLVVSNPA